MKSSVSSLFGDDSEEEVPTAGKSSSLFGDSDDDDDDDGGDLFSMVGTKTKKESSAQDSLDIDAYVSQSFALCDM